VQTKKPSNFKFEGFFYCNGLHITAAFKCAHALVPVVEANPQVYIIGHASNPASLIEHPLEIVSNSLISPDLPGLVHWRIPLSNRMSKISVNFEEMKVPRCNTINTIATDCSATPLNRTFFKSGSG
jgi:hypothetical protein